VDSKRAGFERKQKSFEIAEFTTPGIKTEPQNPASEQSEQSFFSFTAAYTFAVAPWLSL
jgi:hypothetical protein